MQCNWYEYLKKMIVDEPDIDLLVPARRAFFHGQVKFALIAEFINKEQFVELETLILRGVVRYGGMKEESNV